jgi:hypothetical protein
MNPLINYFAAAVIALVSGTGGWATLQLVINRRGRKAEAGRVEAETEAKKAEAKKTEADRLALLAEVERKAYASAEAAADRRYGNLEKDYEKCRAGLQELKDSVGPLIDAIEAIMARVVPLNGHDVTVTVTGAEIATVRAAIREGRRHLN